MELFEGFLMIYAIVFYKDIENLPAKERLVCYKLMAAIMTVLSCVHIAYLEGLLKWKLYKNAELAGYNLALNLAMALFALFSILYTKRQAKENNADEEITPVRLCNLVKMYRLREFKDTLWAILIPLLLWTIVLTNYYDLSTSWIVFLGTVAVFIIVYVLYEFQELFIECASPFGDVPKKALDEWLARDSFTEEEQETWRKRLIEKELIQGKEELV